jgi:hypothetical protein
MQIYIHFFYKTTLLIKKHVLHKNSTCFNIYLIIKAEGAIKILWVDLFLWI